MHYVKPDEIILDEANLDDITTEALPETKLDTMESLPIMARNLRKINFEIERIKIFEKQELSRIKESCEHRINGLLTQTNYWKSIAKQVLDSNGYVYGSDKAMCKYEMPSVGIFRYSTTRQKVDTEMFDAMSEEDRLIHQDGYPDCFTTKITVAPNKKRIAELLQEDGNVPRGFSLTDKQETFDFKEQ